MISENDPAGMGIAFTNAINRYTEHACRLITSQDRYGINFGKDIHLPDIHDDDFGEVEQLLKDADIVHFHMLSDENRCLGPLVIRDYMAGKRIIHHHHGHPDYLINIGTFNDKYKKLKRRVIVSTPDLLKIAADARWVPNLVPIFDHGYLPRHEQSLSQEKILVCQAPTRKFDKNTSVLQQVLQELQVLYPQVESCIIERLPYDECLRVKRRCHIVFDHMRGWFGISSLESLSHGKPVIAGLDEWCMSCIREFTGSDKLPWQVARSEDELRAVLQDLVESRDRRETVGKNARVFMEEHWTENHVLKVLFDAYAQL